MSWSVAGAGTAAHRRGFSRSNEREGARATRAAAPYTVPPALAMNATVQTTMLQTEHLKTYFPIRRGLFQRVVAQVRAVEDVSLTVYRGETLGVVGESGCGKTTLGRTIVRLLEPTAGRVRFRVADRLQDLAHCSAAELRHVRRDLQIVFQDPYSSLNPRMTVKQIVAEPLRVQAVARGTDLDDRVSRMLERVGLSAEHLERFPHAFSGGQRQRIAIARAMVLEPRFLVADEPVSALDVSVQAQILNLLLDLQTGFHLTLLFIAHDIDLVRHLSDRIAVMYLGQVVEVGSAEEVSTRPAHPYTETLLSSVPLPIPRRHRQRPSSAEELPDPANPPAGCYFHPRCTYAQDECRREAPALTVAYPRSDHVARCHFSDELALDGLTAEVDVAHAVAGRKRDLEARLAGASSETP